MALYRFAGLYVEMEARYDMLKRRSAKYSASENAKPDIIINLPETVLSDYQAALKSLTLEECEYMAIGTYFSYRLLDRGAAMLHSSAVAYEGRAYLFSAPCGTGKSTHTALWKERFGSDNVKIINDDKPAVFIESDRAYAWGTPFSGKNDISENEGYPIAGICFIEQGAGNIIRRIMPSEAFPLLLSQTVRPANEEGADKFFSFANSLLKNVPIWKMTCNMSSEAAMVSYTAMKPKE